MKRLIISSTDSKAKEICEGVNGYYWDIEE